MYKISSRDTPSYHNWCFDKSHITILLNGIFNKIKKKEKQFHGKTLFKIFIDVIELIIYEKKKAKIIFTQLI